MATDKENSCQNCTTDPNYAIICSFFDKFALKCGINHFNFLELQEMLEDTVEVRQPLIDLHIKLLRKTRKTCSVDKWEKVVTKFCHSYSKQDGWELERFGYKNSRIEVKLRLLKHLLEAQFDSNTKFKSEVNKVSAIDLREEPLGRDQTGHTYWCQFDPSCNIRIYKEDPDEESWDLIAKDRVGLVGLIDELSSGEGQKELNSILNDDSNSQEIEKPITDTGQVSSSPPGLTDESQEVKQYSDSTTSSVTAIKTQGDTDSDSNSRYPAQIITPVEEEKPDKPQENISETPVPTITVTEKPSEIIPSSEISLKHVQISKVTVEASKAEAPVENSVKIERVLNPLTISSSKEVTISLKQSSEKKSENVSIRQLSSSVVICKVPRPEVRKELSIVAIKSGSKTDNSNGEEKKPISISLEMSNKEDLSSRSASTSDQNSNSSEEDFERYTKEQRIQEGARNLGTSKFIQSKKHNGPPGSKLDEIFKFKRVHNMNTPTNLPPQSQPMPAYMGSGIKKDSFVPMKMDRRPEDVPSKVPINVPRVPERTQSRLEERLGEISQRLGFKSKNVELKLVKSSSGNAYQAEDLTKPKFKEVELRIEPKLKRVKTEEPEFSEAVEEPLMLIRGEGSGADCNTGNPRVGLNFLQYSCDNSSYEAEYSEAIEEPIMFFYGEGAGVDNDTGNPELEKKSENDKIVSENEENNGSGESNLENDQDKKVHKLWSIDNICHKKDDSCDGSGDKQFFFGPGCLRDLDKLEKLSTDKVPETVNNNSLDKINCDISPLDHVDSKSLEQSTSSGNDIKLLNNVDQSKEPSENCDNIINETIKTQEKKTSSEINSKEDDNEDIKKTASDKETADETKAIEDETKLSIATESTSNEKIEITKEEQKEFDGLKKHQNSEINVKDILKTETELNSLKTEIKEESNNVLIDKYEPKSSKQDFEEIIKEEVTAKTEDLQGQKELRPNTDENDELKSTNTSMSDAKCSIDNIKNSPISEKEVDESKHSKVEDSISLKNSENLLITSKNNNCLKDELVDYKVNNELINKVDNKLESHDSSKELNSIDNCKNSKSTEEDEIESSENINIDKAESSRKLEDNDINSLNEVKCESPNKLKEDVFETSNEVESDKPECSVKIVEESTEEVEKDIFKCSETLKEEDSNESNINKSERLIQEDEESSKKIERETPESAKEKSKNSKSSNEKKIDNCDISIKVGEGSEKSLKEIKCDESENSKNLKEEDSGVISDQIESDKSKCTNEVANQSTSISKTIGSDVESSSGIVEESSKSSKEIKRIKPNRSKKNKGKKSKSKTKIKSDISESPNEVEDKSKSSMEPESDKSKKSKKDEVKSDKSENSNEVGSSNSCKEIEKDESKTSKNVKGENSMSSNEVVEDSSKSSMEVERDEAKSSKKLVSQNSTSLNETKSDIFECPNEVVEVSSKSSKKVTRNEAKSSKKLKGEISKSSNETVEESSKINKCETVNISKEIDKNASESLKKHDEEDSKSSNKSEANKSDNLNENEEDNTKNSNRKTPNKKSGNSRRNSKASEPEESKEEIVVEVVEPRRPRRSAALISSQLSENIIKPRTKKAVPSKKVPDTKKVEKEEVKTKEAVEEKSQKKQPATVKGKTQPMTRSVSRRKSTVEVEEKNEVVEVKEEVVTGLGLNSFSFDFDSSGNIPIPAVCRKRKLTPSNKDDSEIEEEHVAAADAEDDEPLASKKQKLRGKVKKKKKKSSRRSRKRASKKKTEPPQSCHEEEIEDASSKKQEIKPEPQADDKESLSQPKPKRGSKNLLGLTPLDLEGVERIDDGGTGRSIRTSRRIAQIKIREQEEERKLIEETMKDHIEPRKKKKPDDSKSHKKSSMENEKEEKKSSKKRGSTKLSDGDFTPYEQDSNDTLKKKKGRPKKKKETFKYDINNPWKSSSGSGTSEEDNDELDHFDIEEEEEEDLRAKDLPSDHEFSPESDLEKENDGIPVRHARTALKEEAQQEEDDTACQKCSKTDHPEWILLCDKCDKGWHGSCLRPALMIVPEGDWFCPPCQHLFLVEKLKDKLRIFEKDSKRRENDELRRKRLAYVGISLSNVLPPPGTKVRLDDTSSSSGSRSGSDSGSRSNSSSSDSSSYEDEPVYQLRVRSKTNQSYRFQDYDQLINSAIQDEMDAVAGAGNQGRGKDIETIVEAEREEAGRKANGINEGEDEEGEEGWRPRVVPRRSMHGFKKKSRKLTNIDMSSADDDKDSDEDFKGSSAPSTEESDSGSSYSGGRAVPIRRSARVRTSRIDREFINDDSEESDAPRKKKSRKVWSETESESDETWGARKKKHGSKISSRSRRKKSSRFFDESESDEPRRSKKSKKSKVRYGLSEDEDFGRKTRGSRRKVNYQESDSDEKNTQVVKTRRVIESDDEDDYSPEPVQEKKKKGILSDSEEDEEESGEEAPQQVRQDEDVEQTEKDDESIEKETLPTHSIVPEQPVEPAVVSEKPCTPSSDISSTIQQNKVVEESDSEMFVGDVEEEDEEEIVEEEEDEEEEESDDESSLKIDIPPERNLVVSKPEVSITLKPASVLQAAKEKIVQEELNDELSSVPGPIPKVVPVRVPVSEIKEKEVEKTEEKVEGKKSVDQPPKVNSIRIVPQHKLMANPPPQLEVKPMLAMRSRVPGPPPPGSMAPYPGMRFPSRTPVNMLRHSQYPGGDQAKFYPPQYPGFYSQQHHFPEDYTGPGGPPPGYNHPMHPSQAFPGQGEEGEFGGLVSYFSSQHEDNLDS